MSEPTSTPEKTPEVKLPLEERVVANFLSKLNPILSKLIHLRPNVFLGISAALHENRGRIYADLKGNPSASKSLYELSNYFKAALAGLQKGETILQSSDEILANAPAQTKEYLISYQGRAAAESRSHASILEIQLNQAKHDLRKAHSQEKKERRIAELEKRKRRGLYAVIIGAAALMGSCNVVGDYLIARRPIINRFSPTVVAKAYLLPTQYREAKSSAPEQLPQAAKPVQPYHEAQPLLPAVPGPTSYSGAQSLTTTGLPAKSEDDEYTIEVHGRKSTLQR